MLLVFGTQGRKKGYAPVCWCGKFLKNAYDSKEKKISKYLWQTTCGHHKDLILSIG